MNRYIPPTDRVQFDHRIRDEWVVAEGALWIDEEGIYKTRVTGVFLDGVNVTGLLTDYDLSEIDSAIEDAWRAACADDIGPDGR
jgi:hypothetical protein